MILKLLSIAVGASLGAWLRWGLGNLLNELVGWFPVGILTANLFGGFLAGLMVPFAMGYHAWEEHLKLLVITGFLGGLTTFSTFSAVTTMLLTDHQHLHATLWVALNLFGSVIMTFLGVLTFRALWP